MSSSLAGFWVTLYGRIAVTPEVHPATLEEAQAAIEWYGRSSVRAAGMFQDELESAIGHAQGTWRVY